VERAANKLFGSGMALVLIVGAILVGLITPWRVRSIAVADARQIVGTSTNLHCEVIQYKNGNKELFINVQGNRSYRQYVTTADDGTLALLAKQGVTYRTIIQGRDFGFACPTKSVSAVCILILIASAFALLRVVIRKKGALTAPAASGV
jgi:ABC-type transport system involved in cytochrome bd biosynthesis fused ATPase/permease subunit